jgi:hypothetical protein
MTEVADRHVPLFRYLAVERRNKHGLGWNNERNTIGTGGLKALAQEVLRRNSHRNVGGKNIGESCSTTDPLLEQKSMPVRGSMRAFKTDEEVPVDQLALIENGAGMPREWVEGCARFGVATPPAAIPPTRWAELFGASMSFLDRWGLQAAALGWKAADIFGCHREAPLVRCDMQGLVFLIGSGEVVAITAATAVIRTGGGSLLTFRRMPLPPGKRPACLWEL